MNNLFVWVLLAIVAIGSGWYVYTQQKSGDQGQVACTMEAKLCPDGSYVGRTGPKCEFTACPTPTTQTGTSTVEAKMNQGVSALGVAITPLELLEDSRCPIDVQCIQAGTVRVRARVTSGLGTSDMIFTLNKEVTTEAESITLTDVRPAPKSTVHPLPSDYLFVFTVAKR